MSIIKIARRERERGYLLMQKDSINNKTLTFAARGLHVYLMSKPDDWTVMVAELINASPSGKHTIYKLLNELIKEGYVKRVQEKSINGQFDGYNYVVYETAQLGAITDYSLVENKPQTPHPDFPYTVNPFTENQPLLKNNNKQKNKAAAREKIAAADLISNNLTDEQKQVISQRIKDLRDLQGYDVAVWQSAIEAEILNQASFKKAKQFFYHKLNIILQQEKSGLWSPGPYLITSRQFKDDEKQHVLDKLSKDLRLLQLEKPGLERSIRLYKDNLLARKSFENVLNNLNAQINDLHQKIIKLTKPIAKYE